MKAFHNPQKYSKDSKNQKNKDEDHTDKQEQKFSFCAGIAIIKTKYPFYRGYQLAEKLCEKAKKQSRMAAQNGKLETSWLDFQISHRGMSGSLDQIRTKKYQIGDDLLYWRPWRIDTKGEMESFEELKKAIKEIAYNRVKERQWPKSKIHSLADSLAMGQIKTKELIKIFQARKLILPEIKNTDANKNGWYKKNEKICTPYYDVIEVMEYYPECLLINNEL